MEEFNQSIIDKWYFILCLWIRLLFKWELRLMRYWYIWLDWYSWNLKVASYELHTCCMLGQSTPSISLLMTIKASLCKSAHSIREEKHFVFYSSMTTHSRKLRLWNLKIIQTKKNSENSVSWITLMKNVDFVWSQHHRWCFTICLDEQQ